MIPDSLAPGIVIRAPDKTSAREFGDAAKTIPGRKQIQRRLQDTLTKILFRRCTLCVALLFAVAARGLRRRIS